MGIARAQMARSRLCSMTTDRHELHELVDALPDDQVGAAMEDVRRRLPRPVESRGWPFAFAGMIKDGPADGSTPEYLDAALAEGFGSER